MELKNRKPPTPGHEKGYRYYVRLRGWFPWGYEWVRSKVVRKQIFSDEALAKAREYLPDGYYRLLEKIATGPPGTYPKA